MTMKVFLKVAHLDVKLLFDSRISLSTREVGTLQLKDSAEMWDPPPSKTSNFLAHPCDQSFNYSHLVVGDVLQPVEVTRERDLLRRLLFPNAILLIPSFLSVPTHALR
jgi:hypothetical protein